MKFESETSYAGPIDVVLKVLGSEELLRKRVAAAGAEGMVQYSGTNEAHTFSAQVPSNQLPSAARSFLPNGFTAVLAGKTKELTEAGQVHGATLAYDITVEGAPASGSLTFILADGGATTPAKIVGEINVNVLLVGGRIEKSAVDQVGRFLKADTAIVNEEIVRVRAAEAPDSDSDSTEY